MHLLDVFKLWSSIDSTTLEGNIGGISKYVHSAIWFCLFHCCYYENAVIGTVCVFVCVDTCQQYSEINSQAGSEGSQPPQIHLAPWAGSVAKLPWELGSHGLCLQTWQCCPSQASWPWHLLSISLWSLVCFVPEGTLGWHFTVLWNILLEWMF